MSPAPAAPSAFSRVARAAPDGHTLSIGHLNSHVFIGAAYNLSFDLLKDFEPVALLTSAPMVFVARSGSAAEQREGIDRLAEGQSRQGATFGSVGVGSPAHVWAIDFQKQTRHRIPVRALSRRARRSCRTWSAGQIDLAASRRRTSRRICSGGKIKAYAVSPATAGRPRPRFRPSTRPACRASA